MSFEELEERRRIGEDAEVMQYLRDAVVCEHGEFVNSVWEEGMGDGGRRRIECSPGFRD